MEAVFSPAEKKSKGHKCYFCGERFVNVRVLRRHVGTHGDRDLKCELCSKTYSNRQNLKKHMMFHTGERPHSCHICNRTFIQKHTLQSHIQVVHDLNRPEKPNCSTCGAKMRSHGKSSSQCWFCKYARVDNRNLDHSSAVKVEGNMPTATSSGDLQDGPIDIDEPIVKIEADGNHYQDEEDSSLKMADESLQNEPDEQVHTCLTCCETFSSIIDLREHINDTHKNSRPFMCGVCGSRFALQVSLTNHVKTHEEDRPHMCLTCGKGFKQRLGLRVHLQTHEQDKPFSCKTCNARFKSILNLRSHVITHQKERPFQCKECGFAAKTVERLKQHIVVHSDEKPFRCNICNRGFKHRGNLVRHYTLHTGKRLYVCRICGKDFTQSVGLKQHEQVHDKSYKENRKLSCPKCNKKYKLEVMLQMHLKTHK